SEQPALDGPEAHHFEVRAADDAGAHRARFAKAEHRELNGGEVTERTQTFHLPLKVLDLRDGEVCVLRAEASRGLPYIDEAVLIAVDQWPEEDTSHDAEDCGVGADPERQGQDDGNGKALRPPE